ncbi:MULTISPECIES: hypothetical protein [unclassified Oceanobacter]|uniref:hypothetical protein n=1 Tax=unclassified Oceanobacter TaxID=2620260 RepID=UPI002732FB90|nr:MULTISPECIES: hypothetical protein [unclassified Oceanobacter]MDP2507129.1 hypothetical protein [Oceanobacter sp. 3_MG-2023]MDP2549047.1 hypothetical protein [Oceanobacter sp. 4_MG-2023]MDP2609920.1 hypothetical protein [Oceanobacter sp. 1_MG-2023]MDP2613198.1 hypothetical protein [Oceanobacter sp. 2_MG-2023]
MKKHTLALAIASSVLASAASAGQVAEMNGVTYSVGGYIKAEGVFNRPDADAANDVSNSFDATARQSRLNFKTERVVDGHKITTFIEGDFYGGYFNSSTYDWRLRHAYMQIDKVTLGQTWSGAFFATAPMDAAQVNFWGPGLGTIGGNGGTIRPNLVMHYTSGPVRISLQDPVNTGAAFPDMVAAYTQRFEGGSGYTVAAVGRDVAQGDGSNNDDENSVFGGGFSFAGKLGMGDVTLYGSAYTGKGLGVYTGFGVAGAYGGKNSDAEDGKLVQQTGYTAAVAYQVNEKTKATIRMAHIGVDDDADSELNAMNANVIYNYTKGLDLGVEFRKQDVGTLNNTSTFPNIRPKGKQLEVMAIYKF